MSTENQQENSPGSGREEPLRSPAYLYRAMGLDEFLYQDEQHRGHVVGQPGEWLRLHADVADVVLQADALYRSPHYVVLGVLPALLPVAPVPAYSTASSSHDFCGALEGQEGWEVPLLAPVSYLPFSPLGVPVKFGRLWTIYRDATTGAVPSASAQSRYRAELAETLEYWLAIYEQRTQTPNASESRLRRENITSLITIRDGAPSE